MGLMPVDLSILDELKKCASGGVDAPKQKWTEMVLGKVMASHPYLTNYQVTVTFNEVKAEDEYATGTVTVTSDGSSWVYVPFIIESGEVKPVDIMSDGMKYQYMTEERVRRMLEDPTRMFTPSRKPSMFSSTPESGDQNEYKDVDNFLAKVSAALPQRVLDQRIFELMGDKGPELIGREMEKEALAIQVVRGEENYDVRLLLSDGTVEKEAMVHAEVVAELGAAPEDRLTSPISARFKNDGIETFQKQAGSQMFAGEVLTEQGPKVGISFPEVYALNGQKLATLVIGPGFSAQGPEIYGRGLSIGREWAPSHPDGRGVFVFTKGAMEPVTINSRYVEDGQVKMSGIDDLGIPIALVTEDVVVPQELEENLFAIPKEARFYSTPESLELDSPQEEEGDTILQCFGPDRFSLVGGVKVAAVDENTMELILVGLGRPSTEVEGLMSKAATEGSARVSPLGRFDEVSQRPIFVRVPGLMKSAVEVSLEMEHEFEKQPMLKEALGVGDVDSVNTVLGLQLLTPEILEEARSYVPAIEGVQDKLCEVLILARLGVFMRGKEMALLRVVKGIDSILNSLRALEAEV